MSLLMILVIVVIMEIFFVFIACMDDRRDKRIREYKKAIRLMSAYLGRPCENLADDLGDLLAKNKKEV